jgi:hypothetical protein
MLRNLGAHLQEKKEQPESIPPFSMLDWIGLRKGKARGREEG